MSKYHDNSLNLYKVSDFKKLPMSDRSNREFVLKCLARNGLLYPHIHKSLKTDEEIILTAMKQDSSVYPFIPDHFQQDLVFIQKCMGINPHVYDKLPISVRSNRQLVLLAIKVFGVDALWEMPATMFADVEIMFYALSGHGGSNTDLWDCITCGAGSVAEKNLAIMQRAYAKEGDSMLGKTFEDLKHG
jgi:hypothetical protein